MRQRSPPVPPFFFVLHAPLPNPSEEAPELQLEQFFSVLVEIEADHLELRVRNMKE